MTTFDVVASTNENTVVSEYKPVIKSSGNHQSEADLEKEFIEILCSQGYERISVKNEEGLMANLRSCLGELNGVVFSDGEWERLCKEYLVGPNEGIAEKSRKIQEDYIYALTMDDGSCQNIRLLDKENIHNNKLQVMNQYAVGKESGARHDNRYDVTVLVNGLPLVHLELKRRGVPIKEAFNQINRYQRDSFGAGNGLFQYVQIFVISNGTQTKYYSNTTRENVRKEKPTGKNGEKKTSHSFAFTSYWADSKNNVIVDLEDFARTFFARHTVLNILTKYCVFTSENMLLVMRPYQITATERILNKIETSNNYKQYGKIEGGGYVWHTTGSGKTLTSFKTARLATQKSYIDKVLFVVDRKDLDYQTMKEYDRFEKGAANSNRSTAVLKKQLEDPNCKIIITTIQKLANFVKDSANSGHEVYGKRVVFIFDECHRSQFGEMHAAIVKKFKKYNIFGFTGTPILAENSSSSGNPTMRTTEQMFGDRIHAYTIVNAIQDDNVLPFKVDYVRTMKTIDDIDDEQIAGIDKDKAYMRPERIREVTKYILENFDHKTYRNSKNYEKTVLANINEVTASGRKQVEEILQRKTLSGFNSIFAVDSIPLARMYYDEFKKQMEDLPNKKLKIATIFSFAANEGEDDCLPDDENPESVESLDSTSREFLERAISDYNAMFGTNFDTSSDGFQGYYKNVSQRMKNKELDMLIVVNMFLTGFDATTLNTLWVDKNLRMHGLLQAFSRTNRILNSIKTYGNIVCFRNLQKKVDESIALFSDENASSIVLLRSFKDYYEGYDDERGHHRGYCEMIQELQEGFPLTEPRIVGENKQKHYIKLFGEVLRMRNILTPFDEFEDKKILSDRELQDYLGIYQDLYDEWKDKTTGENEKIDVSDDIEFEVELIKQIEINVDYILFLIEKYISKHCQDKEIQLQIVSAIESSQQLRSKKELILNFVEEVNEDDDVREQWQDYITKKKEESLNTIIQEENLNPEKTKEFVNNAFEEGEIKTFGTDIDNILPPMPRFGKTKGNRAEKKRSVIERLIEFFERFFGV